MPHIHELIDFTVVAYIIYRNKVLLVQHKQINLWLPVGGHIELDEDPEEALIREVREESGLEIKILAEKPKLNNVKSLYSPSFLNIHRINSLKTPNHKHIVLIYFAKSKTSQVKLAEREHNFIRWFSKKDLDNKEFDIHEDVKFYALKALSPH